MQKEKKTIKTKAKKSAGKVAAEKPVKVAKPKKEEKDEPEEVEATAENKGEADERVEIKKRIKKAQASRRSKRLNKLEKGEAPKEDNKGVVYIGHLPYGFEEAGLRKFFEQFGSITRLKMPRSKKVSIVIVVY